MNAIRRFARQRTLAQIHGAGAGVALTACVALGLLTMHAWSGWTERTRLEQSVRVAAERQNATRERIKTLDHDLTVAREVAAKSSLAIADTLDARLLTVSTTAGNLDVIIDSLEPNVPPPDALPSIRPTISVAAHGPYPKLVAWIGELRETAPDLTVDSMQLTSATSGSCAARLTFSWWAAPAQSATVLATAHEGSTR